MTTTPGVLDMKLVPVDEVQAGPSSGALVAPADADAASMFERLAKDPNASVDKIERLMALWERRDAQRAEAAFNAAMSAAQREMRPVVARTENRQTQSKYASYAALDAALRPIYTAHGFGVSFNTAPDAPELMVGVVAYVSHAAGFSRTYRIDMPADGKGAKGGDVMTRTHATGSATAYGMRYLLRMIFNVAVTDADDDGNAAGAALPNAPEGYGRFVDDMTAVADSGAKAFGAAFRAAPGPLQTYARNHDLKRFTALKQRAQKAGA